MSELSELSNEELASKLQDYQNWGWKSNHRMAVEELKTRENVKLIPKSEMEEKEMNLQEQAQLREDGYIMTES